MEETYSLVLAFTDDHPSFAHGAEFGMIWEQLNQGVEVLERTVHQENREVIQRAADTRNYSYGESDPLTPEAFDFRQGGQGIVRGGKVGQVRPRIYSSLP